MRSPASAPRASSSCGTWCSPDRAHLADAARARGVRRARARECDACAGVSVRRARRVARLGAVTQLRARGCPPARWRSLLAGWWWGSVRLDALDASVLAPEIGRSAAVTAVVTGPVRTIDVRAAAAGRGAALRRALAPRARAARAAARPLAAARSRARARERPSARRAARRTASTSAAGLRAAASTSSCTGATGGWSAGAAASAASPIASARMLRARSRLGSQASGTPCSPGSCSARTRG